MFGSLDACSLAIVGLAMLSAGGLAYALLYGRIQNENASRAAARASSRARAAAIPDRAPRASRRCRPSGASRFRTR